MRKVDLERIHRWLSRRRALQGLGASVGSVVLGCGDDALEGAGTSSDTATNSGNEADSSVSATDGVSGETVGTTSGSGDTDDGTGTVDDTTGGGDHCSSDGGRSAAELLAPIDTIVVVMMENRSFDHFIGALSLVDGRAVDGLTGSESNPDVNDVPVGVFEMTNFENDDPPHGWDECHAQWNAGKNDGFVKAHQAKHPGSYQEVMGYHVRDQLPIYYALADDYTVCDRWFASVMGPTWPNRFYLHCATSGGQKGNLPQPLLTSIWDVLDDAGITGRNYYTDVAWLWGGFTNPFTNRTAPLEQFFDEAAQGTLPAFSIIDPGFMSNDDHPPHSLELGQAFIATVYQALAQSPQWNRCLLVITYDEHGGFFDHVPPPIQPADLDPEFRQLGFRVPSLVVGPYVREGCVDSTQFDHVSVLATLTRRFSLPWINGRAEATNDLSSCIDPDLLNDPRPPATLPMMDVSVSEVLKDVGTSTSQPEVCRLIDSGRVRLGPGQDKRREIRQVMMRMLERGERLGAVKLRP